jgi:hypothetical protein
LWWVLSPFASCKGWLQNSGHIVASNRNWVHVIEQVIERANVGGGDVVAERPSKFTRTISRLIDEMNGDLARLDCSPWDSS